jgi:hypothetical protein
MMEPVIVLIAAISGMALVGGLGFAAWQTKLKVKHGYPLENMWGMPIHPRNDAEATERLKLVTQENAQLRAELGSVKDRLANVERIVTDSGYRLSHDIERLRDGRENMQ